MRVLLAVAKELEYPEGAGSLYDHWLANGGESNLLGLGPIIQFTLTISEFPQWTWVLLVGKVTHIIIIPTTTLTTGWRSLAMRVCIPICVPNMYCCLHYNCQREVIDFRLSSYSKSCRNITPLFQPFPSRG